MSSAIFSFAIYPLNDNSEVIHTVIISSRSSFQQLHLQLETGLDSGMQATSEVYDFDVRVKPEKVE